ncbi:hypothetical protein ABK905_19790 [Acerihabitans sp. KWT182]|uniref:Uncharacterized protein n=1 Tax=Acerihabitans sp. KWT182 TaxID=3157919 RepID=A0AAU7Q6N6_9GAMM
MASIKYINEFIYNTNRLCVCFTAAKSIAKKSTLHDAENANSNNRIRSLERVSHIALDFGNSIKTPLLSLTQWLPAVLFYSLPLSQARNIPDNKNNDDHDFLNVGEKLRQMSLNLQQEKDLHVKPTAAGKMRIKKCAAGHHDRPLPHQCVGLSPP